jgi:sulfate transporter 3
VICRLGFVIDFLSKATLVGFMAGAAVIVSLQQLKGLLGIVHFTSKMQMIPVMSSVLNQRDEVIINQNKFILFLFFIFLRNTLDIYTKGAFRYIFF